MGVPFVPLNAASIAANTKLAAIKNIAQYPLFRKKDNIVASAKRGLRGCTIKFSKISVGATENIILAACFAKGKTRLRNCALEPEVEDLINFLKKIGCKIIKIGKRSIDNEKIEKIVNAIVRKLENSGETEIKSNIIGQYIMEALMHLDQVAYVRFASVYKNFREAKDFEDFLGNLEDK